MYETNSYKLFKSYFNALLPRLWPIDQDYINRFHKIRDEYTSRKKA